MEVLDGVLLPRHLRAGPVDEDAVLVDHVHDGRDLALAGAVLQHSHAADTDELLERLQEEKGHIYLVNFDTFLCPLSFCQGFTFFAVST